MEQVLTPRQVKREKRIKARKDVRADKRRAQYEEYPLQHHYKQRNNPKDSISPVFGIMKEVCLEQRAADYYREECKCKPRIGDDGQITNMKAIENQKQWENRYQKLTRIKRSIIEARRANLIANRRNGSVIFEVSLASLKEEA